MDYLIEIERAKAVTEQAMNDARTLADQLPDGLAKIGALTLVSQLVQATVMLSIRRPAVPCRLDFVAADGETADAESIPELANGLAGYVPKPMSQVESTRLLSQITNLVGKVDADVARSVLNRALEDLNNEVLNIENGHRVPQ